MAVRIITDSTADLPSTVENKITKIPLTVRFGDEEYIDGVTIDHNMFYEKLAESNVSPTTSQANLNDFERLFEEISAAGDSAVVITISSELSGTYHNALLASEDHDNIYVVDSRTLCIASGILAEQAYFYAKEGKSAAEIAELVEQDKNKVKLVAMFDTVEYLKRGGRISSTVAFVGGLLSIKPIITVRDGRVAFLGKARGTKQGKGFMNSFISEHSIDFTKPICFGYTGLSTSAIEAYIAETRDVWRTENTPMVSVGSVVGTHSGPNAIAVAFFEE